MEIAYDAMLIGLVIMELGTTIVLIPAQINIHNFLPISGFF